MESHFTSAMELGLAINAITIIMTLISLVLLVFITFVKGASQFNHNFDGAIGYLFLLIRCALLLFLTFDVSNNTTELAHFANAITAIALTTYNCAQWWQFQKYERNPYVLYSRVLPKSRKDMIGMMA